MFMGCFWDVDGTFMDVELMVIRTIASRRALSQSQLCPVHSFTTWPQLCICWSDIWEFPEIGVPLNHPFLDGIFHEINQPFRGSSFYGNFHISTTSPMVVVAQQQKLASGPYFVCDFTNMWIWTLNGGFGHHIGCYLPKNDRLYWKCGVKKNGGLNGEF